MVLRFCNGMLGIGVLTALLFAASAASRAQSHGSLAAGSEIEKTVGNLTFHQCELGEHPRRRRVQCAEFTVPEDYEAATGREIALRVVRLPARDGRGTNLPLLAIAGGPGQAASEVFLQLDHMLPDVARSRDIYLVDQRGTGGSNPQHCALGDELLIQSDDLTQIRQLTRECLSQFDGDPTLYTTSVAILDLEAVRKALDLASWNLFGVSYGTRVVQHYLRRQPEVIHTAIMDSVVPATRSTVPDIAVHSQRALNTLIARCETDAACSNAFPGLAQGLESLLADLEAAPHHLRVENTGTGRLEDMLFTRAHLVAVLRLSLYQSEQRSTLPTMLHQAYAHANYTALARTADAITRQVADNLALGMHNSVICTEDAPFFTQDRADVEVLNATYLGDRVLKALQASCEIWPSGRRDEDFREPVTADVPILLLSGESDPVTPPAYAEAILAQLPRGRHVVAPGQGHFVSPRGCLPAIIAQFVASEGRGKLTVDCLDRLQPTPLFINANGPTP